MGAAVSQEPLLTQQVMGAVEKWLLEGACVFDMTLSQPPAGVEQTPILVEINSMNVEMAGGQKLVVQRNPLERAVAHPCNN